MKSPKRPRGSYARARRGVRKGPARQPWHQPGLVRAACHGSRRVVLPSCLESGQDLTGILTLRRREKASRLCTNAGQLAANLAFLNQEQPARTELAIGLMTFPVKVCKMLPARYDCRTGHLGLPVGSVLPGVVASCRTAPPVIGGVSLAGSAATSFARPGGNPR